MRARTQADDLIRRQSPKARGHVLNVRIDGDLARRIRREVEATPGASKAAIVRLALVEGLPRVEAARIERQALRRAR